ncbi:MAG: ATP-binding cassette domain-containing protein [Acidobacteria bacterium]|nr:ATP-binding cassette domain-containing protein [Acidobacteriota bacterium]
MIKVDRLTKRYGPTLAVEDITFEVEKGEIVGFLGPNGAGKTTTMRILTCFLPPTSGSASVSGYDVLAEPLEVKKRIGYLPETPPLYLDMTVDGYLDFVGRLKGIAGSDIAARVDAVIERCSLGDVRKKLTGHLSKGYRQRVGLAQALIHNPDVLILDEPTAGLDPKQITEVRQLIHELSGEHTIILSTHILPEVQSIADRIIIINDGKLEADDSPENLIARMQGAESVLLDVDGPPEDVESRLLAVPGVHGVSRKNGHSGRTNWEIETGKEPNIRRDLARAVVESGWGLYEIRSIGMSLEDIFLKLTASDPVDSSGNEPAAATGSDESTHDGGSLHEAAAPPETDEASKQEGADPS